MTMLFFAGLLWLAPKLLPEPSVEQGGQIVRGNRILLIQDKSGSMTQWLPIWQKTEKSKIKDLTLFFS